MSDLGPPPPPKKVAMPVMTEADKKRLGAGGSPPPPPPPLLGPPMMMAGSPMPFSGGFPSIGGMGPNLVFNFHQPYGMALAAVGGGGGDERKEEPPKDDGPPPLVQGDPTWCQPRTRARKGQPLKKEPCVIM